MSLIDKVKNFLSQHEAQVDQAIDKAGDIADQRTGSKYSEQIDKAQEQAKKMTGPNEPRETYGTQQGDDGRQ
jgi:MT0933-like antitoxin protein